MRLKRIAYILTIIANIVLLVHIVAPHHHHKSQICILSNHCQSNNTENHQQDNQAEPNSCLLSQTIPLPHNTDKEYQNIAHESHIFINITQECLNERLILNPIEFFFPLTFFISFSYINSSLELRGPPAV